MGRLIARHIAETIIDNRSRSRILLYFGAVTGLSAPLVYRPPLDGRRIHPEHPLQVCIPYHLELRGRRCLCGRQPLRIVLCDQPLYLTPDGLDEEPDGEIGDRHHRTPARRRRLGALRLAKLFRMHASR